VVVVVVVVVVRHTDTGVPDMRSTRTGERINDDDDDTVCQNGKSKFKGLWGVRGQHATTTAAAAAAAATATATPAP
jgi:hypothetical protein